MAIVLPIHGQLLWDTPLDLAIRHLASTSFLPNDHGYLNWSSNPANCTGGGNPAAGSVRMVKLPRLPQGYTISSVTAFVSTAGVALTAGQCFAGIYDSAGTRQGVTADQSAVWNTTGLKNMALTVPYAVPSQADMWAALLYNGTSCSFAVAATVTGFNDLYNANLTAANARYTIGPAAQTSLPASITMASRTNSSQATWMAVS